MKCVDLTERSLAQNIDKAVLPAVGIKLGAHVEGITFVKGESVRFNIRKGMDLSLYKLHFNKSVEKTISSEPCVAISILLDASGEGIMIDPKTNQTLSVPHKGGTTYICILNDITEARSIIPKNTNIYGIDIRLTLAFMKSFKAFPTFSSLTSAHRLHKISSDSFWVGYTPTSRQTLHNVNEIISAISSENNNDLLLESHVLNIVSDIILLMQPPQTRINHLPISLTNRDKRLLLQARELMLNELAHPWKINELSSKIGLNEKKLKVGFRSEFGIPVYRFLQRERLRFSKVLLEQGQMNIIETALTVGYANASHFAFLFKREFGCSPSDIKNS